VRRLALPSDVELAPSQRGGLSQPLVEGAEAADHIIQTLIFRSFTEQPVI
jgi:hypothetical protein